MYLYLQQVQGYLAPPITAVFLLGLFAKRINTIGAVAGLITGFILGFGKITLQAVVGAGADGIPSWLTAVADFNFLYFSGVLFAATIAVVVGVSLITRKPDQQQIAGLTYATQTDEQRRANRASVQTRRASASSKYARISWFG